MAVPAGSHLVEIREAGTGADTTPAVTATIDLAAGNRYDAVAHVDQAGAPMVSLFLDDVSPLPPGQARAVVRNTAATGPIDVRFGPTVAAAALANGAGSTTLLPAGVYELAVSAAGTPTPITPTRNVTYPEGTATFMYLIGSSQDADPRLAGRPGHRAPVRPDEGADRRRQRHPGADQVQRHRRRGHRARGGRRLLRRRHDQAAAPHGVTRRRPAAGPVGRRRRRRVRARSSPSRAAGASPTGAPSPSRRPHRSTRRRCVAPRSARVPSSSAPPSPPRCRSKAHPRHHPRRPSPRCPRTASSSTSRDPSRSPRRSRSASRRTMS